MPSLITTQTEREVGRLAGVLEQIDKTLNETRETIDETRDDVKDLQVSLRENTVLTSQLTTRLINVENQVNEYTALRNNLRGAKWVLGAIVSLICLTLANIFKVFSGLPGLVDPILAYFHLK